MAHLRLVDADGVVAGEMTEGEAAYRIAALHRDLAAKLQVDSRIRALMLRSAGRWETIATAPEEVA